jgi:hypothetical protein
MMIHALFLIGSSMIVATYVVIATVVFAIVCDMARRLLRELMSEHDLRTICRKTIRAQEFDDVP